MPTLKFFLILLFFPILGILGISWIIYWKFFGEKEKQEFRKKRELRKKWSQHLRNFSPGRLKNRSWRMVLGKRKPVFNQKRKKTNKKRKNKIIMFAEQRSK